jgi:hypothetical protein
VITAPALRARRSHAHDLRAAAQRSSHGRDVLGERLCHAAEVDRAGVRRIEPEQPRGIRLQLGDGFLVDHLDVRDAVGGGASLELRKSRQLVLAGGEDELSTAVVRDPVVLAIGDEVTAPLHAQARLQRAGRVVDPGVHHPAVVSCLVRGDGRLLLEHDDAQLGATEERFARDGEPEDATADHDEVRRLGRAGLRATRVAHGHDLGRRRPCK